MTKRILSVLLTAALILSCFTVVSAAEDNGFRCMGIRFTDSAGETVTELKNEPMTAKVTVVNNSSQGAAPVVVVTSYEDGIMNGIWYEKSDTEIAAGESGEISVNFTPVTIGDNTEIKAIVLRDMKGLAALSKRANMLSGSTSLEKISVNGKALEDYSDTKNIYLYETNGAIESIDAVPADGGETVEIRLADKFPGVSTVTVTASNGTKRIIQIVAYEDEADVAELIPVETTGSGGCWAGSKFGYNSSGKYEITGKENAALFQHIRYVYGGFPEHTVGERILKMDLNFTPTKYEETATNGSKQKALVYFRTTNSGDFWVYPTTELTEGETYNVKVIIDKDCLVHIWYADEYFEHQLPTDKVNSINLLTIGVSSPLTKDEKNTVVFDNPVYTLYPTSYTEVSADGEVPVPDTMSVSENENAAVFDAADSEGADAYAAEYYADGADIAVYGSGLVSGETSDTLTVSGKAGAGETVSFMLLDSAALGVTAAESDEAIKATVDAYNAKIDAKEKMSKNEIFYFGTLNAGSDGTWSAEIPMTGTDRKDITLISSGGDTDFINYASVEYRKNIIPVLKGKAAAEDDGAELAGGISEYIIFISDMADTYQSDISNKTAVAALAKPGVAALDSAASDAVAQLKKIIDKAITVEGVSEGAVTDYTAVTAFVTDNDALVKSLNDAGRKETVSKMSKKSYKTFEEYDAALLKQLAFCGFYNNANKAGDNLAAYLTDYNEYLGLDLSGFNALSKTDRAKAAKKLSEMTADDTAQMQTNLKKAIKTGSSTGGSTGGSGSGSSGSSSSGSSGGSSGGGIYSASAGNSVTDKNILEQKFVYPDMKDAAWAADAVQYLTKNGIVSGYEDNSFRPNAPITRAEFTKIVVKAFFGDTANAAENVFGDVAAGDWFAEVVATAHKEGIISGDGSGSFRPNDLISRQDMAIIIYNAARKFNLIDAEEANAEFTDSADISDYAKAAVFKLKSKGIISGMEDGSFKPLENADRAAAAQMIYSLIIKNNG